jgi:hypothetical protein
MPSGNPETPNQAKIITTNYRTTPTLNCFIKAEANHSIGKLCKKLSAKQLAQLVQRTKLIFPTSKTF